MIAAFFQQTGTTMNNFIRIVTAIIVLCIGSFSAGAEEWSYTGYYPYVYAPSSNTWYYFPDSPPLVWNYSAGNWVNNPFGERSFDIRNITSVSEIGLVLHLSSYSDDSIILDFSYPNEQVGTFEYRSESQPMNMELHLDATDGTMMLFGTLTSDSVSSVGEQWGNITWPNSFTVLLKFETANSGRYTYIGYFDPQYQIFQGFPSSGIFKFTGTFSATYIE
jgi:hypothetical protein